MKVWLLREIWKHFQKVTPNTAKCNMCSKILKTSGNTTNLKTHLKQKHYSILQHLSDEKKETEKPDAPRKKKLPLQPKSRMLEVVHYIQEDLNFEKNNYIVFI
jgi:hypothetical protein